MEIEVHQRGGLLGMDRRYLVKDGTIEVIDGGQSRGAKALDPSQAARIHELATSAEKARVKSGNLPISDDLETKVDIRRERRSRTLRLRSGDEAPPEVYDLIGEVSRASAD